MIEESSIELMGLSGIGVSPGIILGKAHLVDRSSVKVQCYTISDEHLIKKEVARFRQSLKSTRYQLNKLKKNMPEKVKEHAFILESYLLILKDNMLTGSTINKINTDKINAEWALKKTYEEIKKLFEQIDDVYIKSRVNDVENVTERILRNLSGRKQESLSQVNGKVIVVAHDLTPADASELNVTEVMGFVTNAGGRTSHTGIMAQSLDIPAVVGLENITELVEENDFLIVDGTKGLVLINPDEETINFYKEKHLQQEKYKTTIVSVSHLPATTLDGHKIDVKANVELMEELDMAKQYGCMGIGLYRTEFLYLKSKGFPSEEELFENYKKVASTIYPDDVTIRTLDLGGDKFLSELNLSKEMNPALGLRAIRLCLKERDMFKTQLRAILKASAFGKVRIMFPMISGMTDFWDAKEVLIQAKDELSREHITYDHELKTGIMIEIPSAVIVADVLAKHVDFFSIGTNDLIQYALAIDRNNEHVANMFQPFHPAIIKMIKNVVDAADKASIDVSLCGEMAGDPLCISMLLGLGVKNFSMAPRSIPLIKKIIRGISIEKAKIDFEQISDMNTSKNIKNFVIDRLKHMMPELIEKGYMDS